MVCEQPGFLGSGILIFRMHSKEENAATQSENKELKHKVTEQLSQQKKEIITRTERERERDRS